MYWAFIVYLVMVGVYLLEQSFYWLIWCLWYCDNSHWVPHLTNSKGENEGDMYLV